MPRCTRSIVLVLLGTGLTAPGCDKRQRSTPVEPDEGSFDVMPTTNPADGGGGGGPYRYGSSYHSPGMGWIGGSLFNSHPGVRWSPSYSSSHSFSSSSSSHSFSSSHISGHTSFGGFGSHGSSSHASS